MNDRMADAAGKLLALAKEAGADAADVLAVAGEAIDVELRDGVTEKLERSEDHDFGLRVLVGRGQAVVSTSRDDAASLRTAAERAVAMAKAAPPDNFAGLAASDSVALTWPDLMLADEAAPDAAALIERARAAEQAGRDVPGVTRSNGASASASRRRILLIASNGFAGSYGRTAYSISASMIAGTGTAMERDHDWHSALHWKSLRQPGDIGRVAGERAVRRLDPRKVPSGKVPVMFENRIAGGIAGHLIGAILGSGIARGSSFLKDSMGELLFRPEISILDDATIRRGLASKPFDAEGRATRPTPIIADGRLVSWLLDEHSARQLGLSSTGHASRGTSGPPSPQPTNVTLAAGSRSREALLRDMGRGLLVTELIGMGVNGVTGDYSRGAAGFWIEDGAIAYPVSEITIASNLKTMFRDLEPADDLEFRGAINAPSLLVPEMTLAGT
ncbi:MAG: metallopeptidase TldD-related protein [Aestuariivirgaceae bacterium]